MPSSAKFSVPISSFAAGMPNSSTAGMPSAAIRSTSRSSDSSTERWQTPGIEAISRSTRVAVDDEQGLDQVGRR